MLLCKFAAYFQNTFSWEHLGRAASVSHQFGDWKLAVQNISSHMMYQNCNAQKTDSPSVVYGGYDSVIKKSTMESGVPKY